jgi:hypothetical protein
LLFKETVCFAGPVLRDSLSMFSQQCLWAASALVWTKDWGQDVFPPQGWAGWNTTRYKPTHSCPFPSGKDGWIRLGLSLQCCKESVRQRHISKPTFYILH